MHQTAPPGIDLAKEARTARSRFYPITVAYTAYAMTVLPLGLRADPVRAVLFCVAGVGSWTLVEYLVHRYILHRWFPDGAGSLKHRIHIFFDTAHGDHHLRPWDGTHINGRFDTVPIAIVGGLLGSLGARATWPVFIATILQCYVIEEWVHYSVHFHRFKGRYFTYIRRHHLYHHSAGGRDAAYGLSSALWDGPLGTGIPAKDRALPYRRPGRTTAQTPSDCAPPAH